MSSNSFGKLFKLTSFGESHGLAIGGIIDGCPANIELNFNKIQEELNNRRPGQSKITTSRNEADKVEFLSGIFEGKTLGTPIGFIIKNKDQKSKDYGNLKEVYRPSHADYTYQHKYGIRDFRGGGRQSARETACRVVAGAIAKQVISSFNITINAFTSQIGNIKIQSNLNEYDRKDIYKSIVRCPDNTTETKMIEAIEMVKQKGDSLGGIVSCQIKNMPVGIGEPVFEKLQAQLAQAMLTINAVKGFDYGLGFEGVSKKGSEYNDEFKAIDDEIITTTNNSGGIQGGISNGSTINLRVLFKPTSTISKQQETVNSKGENVLLKAAGRHDPCVVPRAVPIVEAMAAMVILDYLLIRFGYAKFQQAN